MYISHCVWLRVRMLIADYTHTNYRHSLKTIGPRISFSLGTRSVRACLRVFFSLSLFHSRGGSVSLCIGMQRQICKKCMLYGARKKKDDAARFGCIGIFGMHKFGLGVCVYATCVYVCEAPAIALRSRVPMPHSCTTGHARRNVTKTVHIANLFITCFLFESLPCS